MSHLIRIHPGDEGRPLSHFQHDFLKDDLGPQCQLVVETRETIESEVTCRDGRTFIRRLVPYRGNNEQVDGVVITLVDITARIRREEQYLRERQQTEKQLREWNRTLESQVTERTEILSILQDITRTANEARTVDEAMQLAVRRIAQYNRWEIGHLWQIDETAANDNSSFTSTGLWHADEALNRDSLEEFQRLTEQMHIQPGAGLVGKVIQSGETLWTDQLADNMDPRSQCFDRLSLHTWIAVPVIIQNEIVAVMEFFSIEDAIPDRRFLEIVRDIGIQLGQVIQRMRLERIVADVASAEQRRIGRELHDSIAQQLTGGALIAESLRRSANAESPTHLQGNTQLIGILKQTHEDVRQLSSGLMVETIDAADLVPTLRRIAAEASDRFGIECTIDDDGYDETYVGDESVALIVYQIARESVHNAVKHSQCRAIRVHISTNGHLELTVHDDGTGFDHQRVTANTNGLRIMQFRAESIGGTVRIQSATDTGTVVTLTVPRRNCH